MIRIINDKTDGVEVEIKIIEMMVVNINELSELRKELKKLLDKYRL